MKTLSIILTWFNRILLFCMGFAVVYWMGWITAEVMYISAKLEAKEEIITGVEINTQLLDTQNNSKIKEQRIKDREKLSKLGL